jgi:general secretion pathway protein K
MRRDGQTGVALVVVLWVIALLSVIASVFAKSTRIETQLARNQLDMAQVRALSQAGIERAAYELLQPNTDPLRWRANGSTLSWTVDQATIEIRAVDETARVDLNRGNTEMIKGLLKTQGGLDDIEAQEVMDKIQDWRDADDLKRLNGAEIDDYKSAGLKNGPGNRDFLTVLELSQVLTVTPELYQKLAPHFTVYSKQQGINPATASRAVLLAIPGMTPEVVEQFIETRRLALQAGQQVPALPRSGAVFANAGNIIRVQALVKLAGGLQHGREAVLHIQPSDPKKRHSILTWRDILEPIESPFDDPITPTDATTITQ